MISFAIIEIDDGFTIVEVLPGQSAEEAALGEGGVLVDEGPYESYEEANDAMDKLDRLDEEESL